MHDLKQLQSMDLDFKIWHTMRKIREFKDRLKVCHVSFSGGKDSVVLLNLVRKINKDIKAVFIDTGLEWPENKKIVLETENVQIIRPRLNFKQVIEKCGYPVVSKKVAASLRTYQRTKDDGVKFRMLNGSEKGKLCMIPKRWQFLKDAPFKISEECCYFLKKYPINKYAKENKSHPFIGIKAEDSNMRKRDWMKNGCSIFNEEKSMSRPLMVWRDKDIWDYIKSENINYSDIYNEKNIKQTGCMFCLFGYEYSGEDKFRIMAERHPHLYEYCMRELRLDMVLDFYDEGRGKDAER